MFKHILIPTDGSKLSNEAAEAAVELAKTAGARITGLFAAPPATPIIYKAMLPVGYAGPVEHQEMIEKASRTYLGAIEDLARAAGVPCEVIMVRSDFPAEAIISTAQTRGCDLIFMASHGHRGLRKMTLLGNETRKVLSEAPVPVLVYRQK